MNAIICFKVVFAWNVLALCLRGIVVFTHTVPLLQMVLEPTGVSMPVKCFCCWFLNGVYRLVRSDGSLQLILFHGVGFFITVLVVWLGTVLQLLDRHLLMFSLFFCHSVMRLQLFLLDDGFFCVFFLPLGVFQVLPLI